MESTPLDKAYFLRVINGGNKKNPGVVPGFFRLGFIYSARALGYSSFKTLGGFEGGPYGVALFVEQVFRTLG